MKQYGQKSPKTEKWLMSPSNPALHLTSSILWVLWDKRNGHKKNLYTFTFNSVQKMAKSDFSHWCEKYWIILEWGTAQALKIGKIYCDITSREYKNDSCGYCLSVAAVSHLVDMPQTPKGGYTCTCAHNSSSCIRCSFLIEMHLLAIETSFRMTHSQSILRSRRGGMRGAHRLPYSQGTFWCAAENTRLKWL